MSERRPGGRKRQTSVARDAAPHVPAAEFKATCLDLMDKVNTTGAEYVITKHGKPVAKLVPVRTPKTQGILGSMKGTVLKYDRPFDPIPGEWDINK
jgi:prevent-host-death family protein